MQTKTYVLEGILYPRHARSSVLDSVKLSSEFPVNDRNLEQLDMLFNRSYPGKQHTTVGASFSFRSPGTKYYLWIPQHFDKHCLRIVSLIYDTSTAALLGGCGSISAFMLKKRCLYLRLSLASGVKPLK